jgi:hypothetical protein
VLDLKRRAGTAFQGVRAVQRRLSPLPSECFWLNVYALAAGSKWQGGRSAAGRHLLHSGQALQRVVGRPLRVFSRGSCGALAALVLAAQAVVSDALVEGRPTWHPVPTQETNAI